MNITALSTTFHVRPLTPADVEAIYALSVSNPLFFEFCPPFVTRESILGDMKALPPRCTYEDKFYVGLFEKDHLVAVLDLVTHCPAPESAFIGLFMMDKADQGRGLGSRIVSELADFLKGEGFSAIRLAYAKGNPQSEHFWMKNGFRPIGREVPNDGFTAVLMDRLL